jgi:RNA polymerase sigma-70 factor (ECF subfamily)
MSENTDAQDAASMAELSGGRERALNELMARHSEKLFHYLLRILQNEEDAADLAQEAFVRVYQNRKRFNESQKFSTWLYAIATNLSRDRLRWRARHPAVSFDEATLEGEGLVAQEELTPRDRLEAAELSETVRRAVKSLPEELRVPLVLAEYEAMSQAEIAAILKCSLKAVETRIYRARKQLRERLQQLV